MTNEFVRSALPRYGRTPRGLLRDPNMTDRAVRLYGLLDDFAGAAGQAFPKRETLAHAMGCSVSAIARELRLLEEAGWVVREARYREDGGQTSTLFHLTAGPVENPVHGGVDNHTPPVSPVTPPRVTGDTPPVSPVTHQEGASVEGASGKTPQPPAGGQPARRRAPREAKDGDPDWEAFWSAYPRKVGKGSARKAWPKAVGKADPQTIIVAARKSAKGIVDMQYVKHPAAWLNAEAWLDEGDRSGRGHHADPTRPVAWRKGMPECEIHAYHHRDNCRGCAADRKAVDG